MFEDRTYETLREEALAQIAQDVDKQEGSVENTAISPAMYKMAEFYVSLNNFIDLVMGDTAVGEYLDRIVADRGITRKPATYAQRKLVTTGTVDIGTRWSLLDTTYKITALLSTNVYSVACEQLGTIGNIYSGAAEALDNVSGVTATLTDIIASGEDIETDTALRARFYAQVRSSGTSGNIHDYRNWALDVPGCGDAKVFPLWNGNGTVKVLVIDENMEIDASLPAIVASYIETVRPIGATVTVSSPTSKVISVSATVVLDGTVPLADVKTNFTAVLTTYLKGTVFDIYTLSYAKIGSLLLSTAGIADYSGLQVNGGTVNITVGSDEMPIAGTVTLTEA